LCFPHSQYRTAIVVGVLLAETAKLLWSNELPGFCIEGQILAAVEASSKRTAFRCEGPAYLSSMPAAKQQLEKPIHRITSKVR
jgi:hypothetical protein